MREYEIMLILRADLSETDLETQVETIKGLITTRDGQVNQVNHWGRRRMAYPIARQQDGYYILFKTSLSANAPMELERTLRINENLLRYLIVREDD